MQFDRGLKREVENLFRADAYNFGEMSDLGNAKAREYFAFSVRKAMTISFSTQQAKVFYGISTPVGETLDYKLPFEFTFIQFDEPLNLPFGENGDVNLRCLFLVQILDTDPAETVNAAHAIVESENLDGNWGVLSFGWLGEEFPLSWDGEQSENVKMVRHLAIACIGYINCENIYLHQEGGAPDKVNRKREKQGKKILEPYYVCRIRGVQYDSNGEPTGEGTHHGFRYDVRGHFRKLAIGKTTWVRPHQRGLQNELYIPKTYVVEKGAKTVHAATPPPAPAAHATRQEVAR